jgi:pyruvate dehydrogenase E2 component (dihydrolipoamide acetyltransferase)
MAAETFDFTMPSLGADMDEGKLVEWLVKPGDVVAKGDIVAVVDTAKAAIEVESFRSGVVERLMVEPGTTVAVGTPLAILSTRGAPVESAPPAPVVEPTPAPPRPAPPPGPLVRKLAAELDVDLQAVQGSGRRGMITRADVKGAAKAGSARARTRSQRTPAGSPRNSASMSPVCTAPVGEVPSDRTTSGRLPGAYNRRPPCTRPR